MVYTAQCHRVGSITQLIHVDAEQVGYGDSIPPSLTPFVAICDPKPFSYNILPAYAHFLCWCTRRS